jgi:hypothetical protein
MIDTESLLTEFKLLCKKMDWFYDYTDDHSVWRKYDELYDKIGALYKDLVLADMKSQADAILKQSQEGYYNV